MNISVLFNSHALSRLSICGSHFHKRLKTKPGNGRNNTSIMSNSSIFLSPRLSDKVSNIIKRSSTCWPPTKGDDSSVYRGRGAVKGKKVLTANYCEQRVKAESRVV